MADDNDKWLQEINKWRDATSHVPVMVKEDIIKGRYRPEDADRGFKAVFEDPLAVQYSLGYKDRKHSLAYDVIKSIASNLSIVAAILQTRCNQVGSFAAPYRLTKSVGFVVKHKDPAKLTTKGEREMIKDLEAFIYNCGAAKPNPHNKHIKRDDFESFLKKIVRDTLLYDQVSVEVVPDRAGKPYEFIAVDASTIRFAAPNKLLGPDNTWHDRPPILPDHLLHSGPYKTMQLYGSQSKERPAYLQVIRGQIENVYTADELFCGVRNPRTDIYVEGYGFGELEQLITIITAMLNAEAYNRNFFTNGSMPMGILNIKGDSMTTDQLEGFKRQWKANLAGTNNSWATPIIQAESGVDWINLKPNNRDMEYSQWMEFLIKVACAVFLLDPAEINFDLHGGVSQTPLFESSQEWKLKASRDRGLKPLLRFIAKMINDNIIAKIDDHFVFDFVGLDELTEQEKHAMRQEQAASYHTLNEIRRQEDLPDVPGGDMIMNPTYIQALTAKQQMEQTAQAAQGQQPQGQQPQQQQGEGGQEAPQDDGAPEYVGTFTKSVGSGDILEITVDEDDYNQWFRLSV